MSFVTLCPASLPEQSSSFSFCSSTLLAVSTLLLKMDFVHTGDQCAHFQFLVHYTAHANYTITRSLGTLRADKEQYCTYKHIRPYANDSLERVEHRKNKREFGRWMWGTDMVCIVRSSLSLPLYFSICVYVFAFYLVLSLLLLHVKCKQKPELKNINCH